MAHSRSTSAPVRALAFGLGFYSCVSVINDAVLERWLTHYVSLWNAMGMAAFLVSLLIWTWAFRNPIGEPAAAPVCLEGSLYLNIVPEINFRLRLLNEELAKYWKVEAPVA